MLHTIRRTFARRTMTLPVIGILAIAATACQGVGLSEARQAVDNQRAINEIEERELRPIERELETLYETEILPRERELEDLWNQVQDIENSHNNRFSDINDPWAPGGAASLLQQEFNEKYAEIDRLYRELDAESRRIQIEQQFDGGTFGVDPAITALEDERFSLQRELDRLHQFGRRPIEDIYLQMNELNASNGWSQTDIYAADELNRQIADIQNQIAAAQHSGFQFTDQNIQELNSIDGELNFLRNEGFFPIYDLKSRISELEQQLATGAGVTTTVDAAGNVITVNPDGTVGSSTIDADVLAQIQQLEDEMAAATESLDQQLATLEADLQANSDSAQVEINTLLEQSVVNVDPAVTDVLQAEIDSLQQQVADNQAAIEATIAALDSQISDLNAQIGQLFHDTDTANAVLEAQIVDLQAQIDALDDTAEDYADEKASLEDQIDTLEADIDAAIADETTQVNALQGQIEDLSAQKIAEQATSDGAIADLQSQIAAKQSELDAANNGSSTAGTVSQDVLEQVAAIEQNRDDVANSLLAEIDSLKAQIAELEAGYLAQIADPQLVAGSVSTTTAVPVDTEGIQLEIQALLDQVFLLESDLNEKIRLLEERRNKLHASLDSATAGGADIAALENKLVQLHDELNALQNSGIDASRNYNLRMEELQQQSVQLERKLSEDIRALEDQIWELDGRINELYRSNNGSSFHPHARFNEQLKQIELDRFELEQRRWDLDDEQRIAFDKFNNHGSEEQIAAEAERKEVLGPLYERIDVLEAELRELQLQQREIEDRLRIAQRSVEDQIREIESQTLDLLDEAVSDAEEAAENLNSGENGLLDGLDPSLLDGIDPTVLESATGEVDPVTGEVVQ